MRGAACWRGCGAARRDSGLSWQPPPPPPPAAASGGAPHLRRRVDDVQRVLGVVPLVDDDLVGVRLPAARLVGERPRLVCGAVLREGRELLQERVRGPGLQDEAHHQHVRLLALRLGRREPRRKEGRDTRCDAARDRADDGALEVDLAHGGWVAGWMTRMAAARGRKRMADTAGE